MIVILKLPQLELAQHDSASQSYVDRTGTNRTISNLVMYRMSRTPFVHGMSRTA